MSMGTDFMMKSILKGMGLEPETIIAQVQLIMQTALDTHARIKHIEEQNTEILSLLKDGKGMTLDNQTAITDEREIPNA